MIQTLLFFIHLDTRQYFIMPQLCTAYKGTYRNEKDKKNESMVIQKVSIF